MSEYSYVLNGRKFVDNKYLYFRSCVGIDDLKMYPTFVCTLRCIFVLKYFSWSLLFTVCSKNEIVIPIEFMLDYCYNIDIILGMVLFSKIKIIITSIWALSQKYIQIYLTVFQVKIFASILYKTVFSINLIQEQHLLANFLTQFVWKGVHVNKIHETLYVCCTKYKCLLLFYFSCQSVCDKFVGFQKNTEWIVFVNLLQLYFWLC